MPAIGDRGDRGRWARILVGIGLFLTADGGELIEVEAQVVLNRTNK